LINHSASCLTYQVSCDARFATDSIQIHIKVMCAATRQRQDSTCERRQRLDAQVC
jgi:hypothetical protein